MRRRIYLGFCLFLLALTPLLPGPRAQSIPAENRALVVLRFNQPHVYYEQPLYDAIAQAVAAKPSVMFDVVSYAPVTGQANKDADWQRVASHNTQAVILSMEKMGVPLSRIRVAGQSQPGINYDEVHVFVR